MAFRDSKVSTSAFAGGGLVCTMPTLVAGDVLILAACGDTAMTFTVSGWTQLNQHTQSSPDGQGYGLFYKIATGSDTATVTPSTNQAVSVVIASYSGRDSGTPGFASTTPNTTSNASPVSISLTGVTAAAGDDLFAFAAVDGTSSGNWAYSTPTGFTAQAHTTAASWATCASFSKDNVSAGATGSIATTATLTSGHAGWSGFVVNIAAASSGAYTLTASAGSYSYSGQSATLQKSKLLTAFAGSYAYAGQAAVLTKSNLLTASAGTYNYTGQSATLLKSKLLTASSDTYSITGQDATITYTPNTGAYTLTALSGSYSISGQSATLLKSYVLTCQAGSYAYTGQNAILDYAQPQIQPPQVSGGGGGGILKKGPVKRKGQVFGEEYSLSPDIGQREIIKPSRQPALKIAPQKSNDTSYEHAIAALMRELL